MNHYVMEPETYLALQGICTALFDPSILTADKRRDLANKMHVFLLRCQQFDGAEELAALKRWEQLPIACHNAGVNFIQLKNDIDAAIAGGTK